MLNNPFERVNPRIRAGLLRMILKSRVARYLQHRLLTARNRSTIVATNSRFLSSIIWAPPEAKGLFYLIVSNPFASGLGFPAVVDSPTLQALGCTGSALLKSQISLRQPSASTACLHQATAFNPGRTAWPTISPSFRECYWLCSKGVVGKN